jgi:ABC-2 type transport system permease protein
MSAGLEAQTSFSPHRVAAMVLRYWYLLRSSWPRLLELIYWPMVQALTWGLIQIYVAEHSGYFVRAGATLIGALLLWEILFRGQLGFSVSFLEEMWARNLGNLMMSPLRPAEFVAALMLMSLVRLAIGMVPVFIVAMLFFNFNVHQLGFAFVFFFINLILTSWAIGIVVSGLLLRHGMGAESLAWTLTFLILPLSCVYYPVSVLPGWLQPFSWLLPPTYVFEGLRALVIEQVFRGDLMLTAFSLNLLYFGAATFAFLRLLESARREGTLMQTGE